MKNTLNLISALILLGVGIMGVVVIILEYNIKFKFIVTLIFSIYLIARGIGRIIKLIKDKKSEKQA